MHNHLINDARPEAALVLADGAVFKGRSIGVSGMAVGEVVFNTAMTGYQEISRILPIQDKSLLLPILTSAMSA